MASSVLTPSADFPVAPSTIDEIQGDGALYYMLSLELTDENTGAGDLANEVTITWTIPDRPGLFTFVTPFDFSWADNAAIGIAVRYRRIMDIYGIDV